VEEFRHLNNRLLDISQNRNVTQIKFAFRNISHLMCLHFNKLKVQDVHFILKYFRFYFNHLYQTNTPDPH
jgi:hypothetical protein